MAVDKTLFSRLRRLFSTNVVVRQVGGRKLKVSDTSRTQSSIKHQLIDRYQKIYSSAKQFGYDGGLVIQQQRIGLFKDYETMDTDSIISSALDIYADESTMKNEYGKVLNIETENANIHDILHNLFYDVINIEFNLWPWVRNMCKYGDMFLYLDIDEKFGITNVVPISPYDVSRVEGEDEENPHLVQFRMTPVDNIRHTTYGSEDTDLEAFQVAHFRLLSDSNFLPYGRSTLEAARKVWKQLTLMEDAMLIHRIMRAPEKRVFKFDIGNIPPAEVENYMQQVVNKMKKTPVMDQTTGDYNLKYNMQNITEDFFIPVRGGDSGTSIETLSGLNYDSVDDIEYLRNRMLASLRVPKAFLGYEEGVEGKATLAAEDVRFARTIERLQRIIVSELHKIAIVHLYAQGFRDQELVNFELTLTNPSTIYEQEKLELWNTKTGLAESMLRDGLMSSDWIYKNIFSMNDAEIKEQDTKIIYDYKNKYRKSMIESEGEDPAKKPEPSETNDDAISRSGVELSNPNGRPKEGPKYKKDGSARGRDPLGSHDLRTSYEKDNSIKHTFKKGPLALAHYDGLVKAMDKNSREILSESDELTDKYKEELNSEK
jgi:hypothetical protein